MRDTIDLIREAGIDEWWSSGGEVRETFDEYLKAFEALVRTDERNRTWTQEHWTEYERSIAAQEREACAKVCDGLVRKSKLSVIPLNSWSTGVADCAAAIRARGETK